MRRLAFGLVLAPLVALAGAADYRLQWPVQLARPDAAAHRIVLEADVYRTVQRADLGDLDVLDRDGAAVPAAVLAPARPARRAPRLVPLPWFRLPSPDGAGARDWAVIGRAGPDGALQEIEARSVAAGSGEAPRTALLVDARTARGPVTALDLQWQSSGALDVGYRVEGSDDLDTWHPVPAQGRLVDLQRDAERLLQRRIALQSPSSWRYLRLTPEHADRIVPITAVHAVIPVARAAPDAQWRALAPGAVRRVEGAGSQFEFELDGRYPIRWAAVAMDANTAVRWHLESRESGDAPWRTRAAPWLAFQLDDAGERSHSPPRVLDATVRDRHWRLTADRQVAQAPALRLGYAPETLVFLAQGSGPYALVAGSARTRRADAPVAPVLAALRERHGAEWSPPAATLGAPSVRAGQNALEPERDWTTWLLWAALIAGALLVIALAVSVLRTPPPKP
ncbi:DUF3999 family protein [Cognatilysobacter bugurensis]|uniref:Membrane protein n=1 Tax=Cognatilysobacter bugurensis TaxID=543356 RepID=A0A918W9C8_9GAMM|nr:DUF3999 family protein [Lysobacter bugurensis]GHA84554.1 membrane protein [Lysobacter bugurensis]